MTKSQEKPPGLHISRGVDGQYQLNFTTADGTLLCNVSVTDNSASDAQLKSLAIGKLRRILDELHLVMKD